MLDQFIFLILPWIAVAGTKNKPMHIYLKDLCPPGMLPLTGTKHVRTCDDLCPLDAQCIQGICCVNPPTCVDLTHIHSTQFACLPNIKQNCPAETKCVPSSRIGMSICCSLRKIPVNRQPLSASDRNGVCPATHPVISHESNQIRLCNTCNDGICVSFRKSDVSVCCQSFAALCGPDSVVEMDGVLARDCTRTPCSQGFECSLTTSGSRICCSLALCSSGVRARAVCAGGCRKNEQCEEINGQRWCCPKLETCPDGKKSNGKTCSLSNIKCSRGYECMQSEEGSSWLCCRSHTSKKKIPLLITTTTFATTTEQEDPLCDNGEYPLVEDEEYMSCPEEGSPCPRAGFVCQTASNGHMFCCPIPEDLEVTTETTTRPVKRGRGKQSLAKIFKEITAIPLITMDPGSGPPSCLFGHVAARNPLNNEIRRCGGFLDFSCPFGFVCQPSTSTAGFLCCAKISKNA